MYRIALILGLLTIPAQAEEFTKPECASLQNYFEACAKNCVGITCAGFHFYENSGVHQTRIQHDMPGAYGYSDRIDDVCQQAIDHKLTAKEATKQFCPHEGRPDRGEWYGHECSTLYNYFSECSDSVDPKKAIDPNDLHCAISQGPVTNKLLYRVKARHHITDDKVTGLCQQVCDHKLTWREAGSQFCR